MERRRNAFSFHLFTSCSIIKIFFFSSHTQAHRPKHFLGTDEVTTDQYHET